jgi:hypothetical protein
MVVKQQPAVNKPVTPVADRLMVGSVNEKDGSGKTQGVVRNMEATYRLQPESAATPTDTKVNPAF